MRRAGCGAELSWTSSHCRSVTHCVDASNGGLATSLPRHKVGKAEVIARSLSLADEVARVTAEEQWREAILPA